MSELHKRMSATRVPDVIVEGAGMIGLAIALELRSRGASVRVLERGEALRQASTAAAGMLAAHDPHNPPAMLPLALHSLSLYPAFLQRVAELSGIVVAYQTGMTLQYNGKGEPLQMAEDSLDPRQLAAALLAAVRRSGVDLHEHCAASDVEAQGAGKVVSATGAWTNVKGLHAAVTPRKGQMLRVALPKALRGLREVHRSEHIYIVPRTLGPQAGTAILGATVENAGFDTTPHTTDLRHLRGLASRLLPELADEFAAPQVEAWAGLRPATADGLPLLGALDAPDRLYATGHYRNGILLAPATAECVADLIEGKTPQVDLRPFSPARWLTSHSASDIRPSSDDNNFLHLR